MTRFTPVHERDLHLIVVNRELTDFHHVHPTLADDGTWSIDLPALPAGSYRAVADFQVADGPRLALGTDLTVAGHYPPNASPSRAAPTDGRRLRGHDQHRAQATAARSPHQLTVRRNGHPSPTSSHTWAPTATSSPCAAGDLAYAHVHPVDERRRPTIRGTVTFDAELDLRRPLRPVLRLQARRVVHTAAFTFDQGPVTGAARHGALIMTMTDNDSTQPDTTVALDIGGMTCASCAARITKRLNKIDGVDASVNYATEQATVTLPDGTTVDELIAADRSDRLHGHTRLERHRRPGTRRRRRRPTQSERVPTRRCATG